MPTQFQFVCLDNLVSEDHIYRKYKKLWNLKEVNNILAEIEEEKAADFKGYGLMRLFLCILLQFIEDLSDRELKEYLENNIAAKLFCEFDLSEKTPHFSLFTKIRNKIGTQKISFIFNELKKQLKEKGYMNEFFTFIDASHLVSKAKLWEERDKANQKKYDQLNNETLPKVAYDKQARIGCKGKNKFWYGYKKNVSVDMQSGMINKVAVSQANVIDSKAMKHVLPAQGAVYADKGYCDKNAVFYAKKKLLHLASIKKNNMKDKNPDLDKYYSKMRAPYERVFSKQSHISKYKGIAKNQFSVFMQAIGHNLKRLVVLEANQLRFEQC